LEREALPKIYHGYGDIGGAYSLGGIRTYKISSPRYLPPENALLQFNVYAPETQEIKISVEVANVENKDQSYNHEYLDDYNIPRRKLSCMWNQRSVDFPLGLGFNILSYALLTHMIAQCVNMDVNELIFNGGDCHIYENQISQFSEQLNRNPYKYALPKLVLNKDITNINDFTYDDIKIEGYKSYPTIKIPLSVGL
jgi:thymidylate synthase